MSEAGSRRQSRDTSGGLGGRGPSASTDRGQVGFVGGRRFGPGKQRRWCVAGGKVLGVAKKNRCEPVRTGSATGGVSDQTSRLAHRPTKPRAGHVRANVCRTAFTGSGGSWSQLVSTASDVPPLEVGDAVYGYSAPKWTALFRRSHKRAVEGVAAEASVGTVQAQRLRLEGSSGCSLTISRLQRLVRGAFFWLAGSASAVPVRRGVARCGDPSP